MENYLEERNAPLKERDEEVLNAISKIAAESKAHLRQEFKRVLCEEKNKYPPSFEWRVWKSPTRAWHNFISIFESEFWGTLKLLEGLVKRKGVEERLGERKELSTMLLLYSFQRKFKKWKPLLYAGIVVRYAMDIAKGESRIKEVKVKEGAKEGYYFKERLVKLHQASSFLLGALGASGGFLLSSKLALSAANGLLSTIYIVIGMITLFSWEKLYALSRPIVGVAFGIGKAIDTLYKEKRIRRHLDQKDWWEKLPERYEEWSILGKAMPYAKERYEPWLFSPYKRLFSISFATDAALRESPFTPEGFEYHVKKMLMEKVKEKATNRSGEDTGE